VPLVTWQRRGVPGDAPDARPRRCTRACPCRHKRFELGFEPFLDAKIQAPIILTFHAPADPRYGFKAFYEAVKARGFILYPGKLTQLETFRVGCIGAIGPAEMREAVAAVAGAMRELGFASGAPQSPP